MTGWLRYALWLDLSANAVSRWARILASDQAKLGRSEPEPEPKRTADAVDPADWRREHLRDDGSNGHGGWAA